MGEELHGVTIEDGINGEGEENAENAEKQPSLRKFLMRMMGFDVDWVIIACKDN